VVAKAGALCIAATATSKANCKKDVLVRRPHTRTATDSPDSRLYKPCTDARGPTMTATRYVDMGGVIWKVCRTLPDWDVRRLLPARAALLRAVSDSRATTLTLNRACKIFHAQQTTIRPHVVPPPAPRIEKASRPLCQRFEVRVSTATSSNTIPRLFR
jgi:hypothetical protein